MSPDSPTQGTSEMMSHDTEFAERVFVNKCEKSIFTKILRRLFLLYFALVSVVTAGHVFFEYKQTSNDVYAELSRVGTVFAPAVSDAIWDLDLELLEKIVDGISALPMIMGLTIRDAKGEILFTRGVTDLQDSSLFVYDFDVEHHVAQETVFLSRVTLVSDHTVVLDRIKIGFIMIVVNALILAIVLYLILLLLFRKYLLTPFQQFVSEAQRIDLDTIGNNRLQLQVEEDNEIRLIQDSFNGMLAKIQDQKEHILHVEHHAQAKLEDEVRTRTIALQKSEKQLHSAQKMEAIGMMAGGVAHDLNNILSGVVTYPELLLMQLPESSELRGPLEEIHASGQRAATVVADLLTIGRGVAIAREPHDINKLVTEFLNSPECQTAKARYPDVTCTMQLDAKHPVVSCSPMHVKKSVMNLLINGLEAVEENGTVQVTTCTKLLGENDSGYGDLPAGEYVVVKVEDDGPGIADKDLEHIFEPFYSKKIMGKSGTGLGLAIVWNAMQDHNGSVFVDSSIAGTKFHLYFPASKTGKTAAILDGQKENLRGRGEHILVVDDEEQLRDIACKTLLSLGYHVSVVSSGEEAVEFIKETTVDLMVLDMIMDPGISGYQTYRKILSFNKQQKALIVSGFSESDDVKAALKLGAGGFINKPYSVEQLGKAVKQILSLRVE